jgi:prophage maintenance system killer protein
VAAHAAYVFLDINGWELDADPDAFYQITMAVADGRADKAAAVAFFRANARRRTE